MIHTQEYMTSPVITASTTDSVLDVAALMNKHNIGSVVIVDDKSLAGIITERDIIRKVVSEKKSPESTNAKEIMTSTVVTVTEDASVMDISGEMKKHSMRRIVVVDENNKPIGIITSRDLIGLLV
jgi:CBS domain-containing protein